MTQIIPEITPPTPSQLEQIKTRYSLPLATIDPIENRVYLTDQNQKTTLALSFAKIHQVTQKP